MKNFEHFKARHKELNDICEKLEVSDNELKNLINAKENKNLIEPKSVVDKDILENQTIEHDLIKQYRKKLHELYEIINE